MHSVVRSVAPELSLDQWIMDRSELHCLPPHDLMCVAEPVIEPVIESVAEPVTSSHDGNSVVRPTAVVIEPIEAVDSTIPIPSSHCAHEYNNNNNNNAQQAYIFLSRHSFFGTQSTNCPITEDDILTTHQYSVYICRLFDHIFQLSTKIATAHSTATHPKYYQKFASSSLYDPNHLRLGVMNPTLFLNHFNSPGHSTIPIPREMLLMEDMMDAKANHIIFSFTDHAGMREDYVRLFYLVNAANQLLRCVPCTRDIITTKVGFMTPNPQSFQYMSASQLIRDVLTKNNYLTPNKSLAKSLDKTFNRIFDSAAYAQSQQHLPEYIAFWIRYHDKLQLLAGDFVRVVFNF